MRVQVRQVRGRKTSPKWTQIADEVKRTVNAKVKPRMLEYPEKVVANWEHKPAFQARLTTGQSIILYVYPIGPNAKYWIWTSRGTKRHTISAKNAPVLAFPSSYAPKTRPRGPSYGGPGKSSGETVFAMEVDHPGTKARHFEEAWARWSKKWFRREIENAMRRGSRRA